MFVFFFSCFFGDKNLNKKENCKEKKTPPPRKINGVMEQLQLELEACRICVTCYPLQEMDFIHLYQPNEEFQQELDFIQNEIRHWQLKIQPDDGLPQRICANCFAKFCSIEAFRKECETAQEKLIETVLQQTQQEQQPETANEQTENVIKTSSDNPLPLMANYESSNMVLDTSNNVLVSSVNLTQSDVSLNDFPVFDQQFSHFDNPTLMDDSSTLLAGNLIASEEATQELGFLPSQNLFTFETAEPPSTGTLPLVETDSTSIMNEILAADKSQVDGGGGAGGEDGHIILKQDDLEQMLKHSIIPTTTKLMQQQQQMQTQQQQTKSEQPQEEKMEQDDVMKDQEQQYNSNYNIKGKNGKFCLKNLLKIIDLSKMPKNF